MSAVEWIVDTFRFNFIDTAWGIVRLLAVYVYLKIGFEEYQGRKSK